VRSRKALRSAVLWAARRLPRGWSLLLYWAAKKYPELRRYQVELRNAPDTIFVIDLGKSVCAPLFKWGQYPHQRLEDSVVPSLLRAGEVVYDVGANIGYTTALYARAIGPSGHVYAFEPARACLQLLKENASHLGNVTVVDCAVGEEGGESIFSEEGTLDTSHLLESEAGIAGGEERYMVSVVTVDAFIAAGNARIPQLLKVDVEGHEPAVFGGARRLIAEMQPIIFFEALSRIALQKCITTLNTVAPGRYETYAFLADGLLVDAPNASGSPINNYLAVPEWAIERVERLEIRNSLRRMSGLNLQSEG
jgi:FkbM family methyltransferase